MNAQNSPEQLPEPDDREEDQHAPAPPSAEVQADAPAPESEPSLDMEQVEPSADMEQVEPSPDMEQAEPSLDMEHVKRVLEAALLSASDPLTVQQLKRLFAGEVDADNIRKVLDQLKDEWGERSIELTAVASGWRFRVKPDYQKFLDRITNEKPPRYSRAVLETLAIIAYRQPATRGDIEEVRGVAVSPPTLNALVERGWIEIVGHRESPGRPAIFATTKKFLDDLNLRSLEELPPLEDLQASLAPPTQHLVTLEAASSPPEEAAPEEDSSDEPPPPESTEQAHAG
jgi:segregation and condensation protein B